DVAASSSDGVGAGAPVRPVGPVGPHPASPAPSSAAASTAAHLHRILGPLPSASQETVPAPAHRRHLNQRSCGQTHGSRTDRRTPPTTATTTESHHTVRRTSRSTHHVAAARRPTVPSTPAPLTT